MNFLILFQISYYFVLQHAKFSIVLLLSCSFWRLGFCFYPKPKENAIYSTLQPTMLIWHCPSTLYFFKEKKELIQGLMGSVTSVKWDGYKNMTLVYSTTRSKKALFLLCVTCHGYIYL